MKTQDEKRTVVRSGVVHGEATFDLANNSKLFEILSSKIYTNIPLAIVRELSTNAHDAHVDAGHPTKPFDVHLPNFLEPWLSIRDYGTGLCDADVRGIYKRYGESSRTSSNNFTGCFGLGSKTPFAYTDQFTVTAYFNGEKRTYSCFKNEDGIPAISMMGSVSTTEENGLEVRVAIDRHNNSGFIDAARNVYEFFTTRPNISGERIVFPERKVVQEGKDFKFCHKDGYGYGLDLYVVMGQIKYKVTDADIAEIVRRAGLGGNYDLFIDMPVGSVSIPVSREELFYDSKTKSAIKDKTQRICSEVKANLEHELSKITGTELEKKIKEFSINSVLITSGNRSYCNIVTTEKDAFTCQRAEYDINGKKLYLSSNRSVHVDTSTKIEHFVFIENDEEKMSNKIRNKIKLFLSKNNNSKNYKTYFLLFKIEDHKKFEERFGKCSIKVSEMDEPPKAPRNTSTGTHNGFIKELVRPCAARMNECWDVPKTIDKTNGCLVIRQGNYIVLNGIKYNPDSIRNVSSFLDEEVKFYGVPKSKVEFFKKDLGLKLVDDKLRDIAKKAEKSLDKVGQWKYHNSKSYSHSRSDISPSYIRELASVCDEIKEYKEMMEYKLPTGASPFLFRLFGINIPEVNLDPLKNLYKKYPMLELIDMSYTSNKETILKTKQYIELVNETL